MHDLLILWAYAVMASIGVWTVIIGAVFLFADRK
jgi:hypothetical protein